MAAPVLPVGASDHAKLSVYESIPSPVKNMDFGDAVAWHDDRLIVGSAQDATVQILELQDGLWTLVQTLEGPGNSRFGSSLAVDADVLVVGAPNERDSNSGYGAAYVYRHGGASWVLKDRLDAASDDIDFGQTVEISGAWIAVSAPDAYITDESLRHTGKVSMYKLQGDEAAYKQTLSDPGLLTQTMFGADLDLQGSRLVVGAPGWYYEDTVEPGSAYIYTLGGSTWSQEADLGPLPLSNGAGFGTAVSQTKDEVMICDDASLYINDDDRSLHIYRKSGSSWKLAQSFDDVACIQVEASQDRMVSRGSTTPYMQVYGREGTGWGRDDFHSNDRPADIAFHRGIAALAFPSNRGGTVRLLGNDATPYAEIIRPASPIDFDGDGTETVVFDARNSTGTDLSYFWYVDDALEGTGQQWTKDLTVGTHTILLAVSDPMLATDTVRIDYTVLGPPMPQPSFSWLPGTVTSGEEVRFVDESTSSYGHIISWDWDLDADGGTDATGPTPTWTFDTPGARPVTLTVRTDIDTEASVTKKVSVRNLAPVADAGMDQIIRDQDKGATIEVSLDGTGSHDPDGTIERFSWVRNGKQFSTSSQPSLKLGAGVHDIDLTVTDDLGVRDKDRVTILILEKQGSGGGGDNGTSSPSGSTLRSPPTAAFSWALAEGPPERAVAFTDRSTDDDGRVVMWWYDLDDDGTYDATEPDPVLGFASFGSHDVRLTVTDEDGLQTETVRNVFLKNGAPTAVIDARTTQAYVGQKVLLVDNSTDPEGSTLTRTWTFGDGEEGTQQAPAHTYTKAGTYTVTLTVEDPGGASDKATVAIQVRDVPPGTTVPPVAGGPIADQAPDSPFADEDGAGAGGGAGTDGAADDPKDGTGSDEAAQKTTGPFGLHSEEKGTPAASVLDPDQPWVWAGAAFVALVVAAILVSIVRRR